MGEKTVRASTLKVGDIILTPGNFPRAWPFYLIMNYFARGYNHLFMIYAENGRGRLLEMESISRCGPTISPLARYFGKEVEVYRINHPLADVFCLAILAAGDEILKKIFVFFDHFSLFPRAVAVLFGFSGRTGWPLYVCSEFLQVCLENAPKFMEDSLIAAGKQDLDFKAVIDIYRNEILAKFPIAKRSKDKIRLMAPYDFKELQFLEFIEKGKLADG